ncbi:MAG: ABC transporter substrate-binding protein, partial [Rhodospirillales bacterium]|nr:ABC transporter substrate-binding protein [Rhodospirillales bacterium]
YKARFGHDPNFAAQVGVMGAELVIKALRDAGRDLTVDSFIAAMERIKDHHDIFGSPPMSFGPDKHQGSNESFLTVVKAGHWVPVDTRPVGY